MQKLIKLIFILSLFLYFSSEFNFNNIAFSDESFKSIYVNVEDCTKIYPVNTEKLFFLTLSALSASRFNILEIQTRSGYILFRSYNKDFLAVISPKDYKNSQIRITPADNSYAFDRNILIKLFQHLDQNFR